jgi:predicted RNase H-like HicB family nuclease
VSEPRYHINIFWSTKDACWVADVPDLKSCAAFGDSPFEAATEVEVAIAAWLETARANNMPIPKPCYRPAIYSSRF